MTNPFLFVLVDQRSSQSSWTKNSKDTFINNGNKGENARPTVANLYPKAKMSSTQINAMYASEEEVHVLLKDMQEAQHAILDQMSILETSIAMIVVELTTMKTETKGSNHSLYQIARLLDHVYPGSSWQVKEP